MTQPPPTHAHGRRLVLTLLALAATVGLLHGLVWERLSAALGPDDTPSARPAVQVRTVTPPALPGVDTPPLVLAKPAPPVRQAPAPKPAPAPEPPRPAEETVVINNDPVLVMAALPAETTANTTAQMVPVARGEVGQEEIPVYRTKLPPAMTLAYELTYGRWTGSGELLWRPNGHNTYDARLEGRVAGMRIITLASQGSIDAAGLAPVRYTDLRRGRGEQAANFQRKAGKITFSGNAAEFPLLQGSQDRLSWMLQLAAIALADPKRVTTPGSRVVLHVVGARGDSDIWAFQVVGPEEVSTPDGAVKTVKLLREPRKPHDTRVEVWLAPNLHYLPVRAKQTTENSSWDLRLQSSQTPT
jgi:hypothetical protein